MLPSLLKNKFVLIAISISLFILILIIVLSPNNPTSQNSTPLASTAPSALSTEISNLSQDKRKQAMIYVETIEKKLPINLATFPTSVGLDTSIHIFRASNDPAEIMRIIINGLSYINKNELDAVKNPNITAFKESYLKSIELLEGQNIDPKKLIIVYGDKEYVRVTSEHWIKELKLRP